MRWRWRRLTLISEDQPPVSFVMVSAKPRWLGKTFHVCRSPLLMIKTFQLTFGKGRKYHCNVNCWWKFSGFCGFRWLYFLPFTECNQIDIPRRWQFLVWPLSPGSQVHSGDIHFAPLTAGMVHFHKTNIFHCMVLGIGIYKMLQSNYSRSLVYTQGGVEKEQVMMAYKVMAPVQYK